MKENWTYKNLTDMCDIQYGYPFDSACFSTMPDDCMPLVRIRDVKDGYTSTFFKGDYPKEYIIRKGDYLIGMDGEFNIAPWRSEDALLNQRVCKVSSKSDEVLIRFLYRFLTKELKKIEDETPFVTVKHLSAKRLNQVVIPVPPIEIQSRIVSELDLLQSIIDKQKAQLKELDYLAQAIFYDMFGDPAVNEKDWNVKILEELLKIPSRNGLTKPTAIRGAGIPMISMGELFANPIITDKVKASLVPVTQRELDSSQVLPGDLLFARQSLSLEGAGKCSYVKSCPNPTVFESHLIRIRVDDKIVLPQYVYCFFRTNSGITEIRKRVYQVAAAGIKGSELIKIPIPVPLLSLQQLFVERVEAIEKQKQLINQSIKDVQNLFDSLMEYYFGE